MENFEHYHRLIEDSIARIGLDPANAKGQHTGQWLITKGTAKIALDLFVFQQEGPLFFSVMSPIMKLPKSNLEKLLLELLQLNHSMAGLAFTIHGDLIFVRALREAAGMDAQEAMNLILRVGNSADFYDEELQKKFPHQQPIGFRTSSNSGEQQTVAKEEEEK